MLQRCGGVITEISQGDNKTMIIAFRQNVSRDSHFVIKIDLAQNWYEVL
jgi:hypothetical protein